MADTVDTIQLDGWMEGKKERTNRLKSPFGSKMSNQEKKTVCHEMVEVINALYEAVLQRSQMTVCTVSCCTAGVICSLSALYKFH